MMKRTFFIALFIVTHIGFIFLHIHKHMQFIRESFSKQKNEQMLSQTLEKKQAKQNELYALQNKHEIKNEAEKKLHLRPVALNQIHKLNEHA